MDNKSNYHNTASKCRYFSSMTTNYDTSRSYSGSYKPISCNSCTNFISQKCTLNKTDVVDDDDYQ